MSLTKHDVIAGDTGSYELLQDAYIDEDLRGGELFRACARNLETGEACVIEWPIKNDSYSREIFTVK